VEALEGFGCEVVAVGWNSHSRLLSACTPHPTAFRPVGPGAAPRHPAPACCAMLLTQARGGEGPPSTDPREHKYKP